MQAVEMRGGMAPSAGYFAGLGVTTHAKGGNRWVFGAEYLYRKHDYRTVTLPSAQFTAEGGYYLQLLSDAGKTLFFHAGVSALAGYETLNWSERTLYDGARLKNGDAFVYGGALTLEMEVYLSDRIALTAPCGNASCGVAAWTVASCSAVPDSDFIWIDAGWR